MASGVVR